MRRIRSAAISAVVVPALAILLLGGAAFAEEPSDSVYEETPPDRPSHAAYLAEQGWAGGDGDGVPEPGERAELTLSVENGGTEPLRNLTLTGSTSTDGITIVSGTVRFPDVPAGGSATAADPVVIDIASSVPRNDSSGCTGFAAEPIAVDGGPVEEEPSSSGASEPSKGNPDEPVSSDDGIEASEPAEPADDAAVFEIEFAATADGGYAETMYVSTMMVCAMAEQGPANPVVDGGGEAGGDEAALDTSTRTSSGSRAAPVAGITAATAGLAIGWALLWWRRRSQAS